MGIATYSYNRSTSGGEIIRELVNSTDGQGLHFDGAAGHVEATALSFTDATQYSFEVIFSTEDATTSCVLIGNSNSSTTRKVLGFKDGILRLGYKEASWAAVSGGTIEANTVYHVVATRDGTTQKIYINGNEVTTGTLDSIYFGATAAMRLAYSGDSSDKQHFTGTLYRTRLWNKTLTAAEVTATYENATVPFADQYGSQTSKLTGNNSTFISGLGDWATGNDWSSQTNPSANMVLLATGASQRCYIANSEVSGIQEFGKKYRVTYTASSITGAPYFSLYAGGAYISKHVFTSGTNSFEYEMTASGNDVIYIVSSASGDAITLDDLLLVEIGCVSDYDLAFANPTQSLLVQDRAGAADGTSSASGVTQVTPIEQLNSKSARIGTSAATPADGELVAKQIRIGDSSATTVYAHLESTTRNQIKVPNDSSLEFWEGGNQNLTIDPYGNLGLGGSPTSPSSLARYLYVGDTSSAGIVLDDTNSTPWEIYNIQGSLYFAPNGGAAKVTLASSGLATFSSGIAFQSATEGSGTSGEAFTLNRYETGIFTPTISFGDASVGIVYGVNDGAYTRIGNICHVAIHVRLTSKGTSTGAAKIEGLPFPGANKLVSTGVESNLTFPYNNDLSAGEYIAAFVTQLTDKIQLREVSSADRTNSNFTDTSDFRLCGSYMCNDA